ncbi:MAG: Rne/Rng family ribonuclease [Alphaproteobacteria bacterium]
MAKRMLIDALHVAETRVVIADDKQIFDFDFVSAAKKQLKGNIYLAKITRVEPSLQAAFVEYGGNKQGFLPFSEIHADYYQIPSSDRERLMKEAEADEDAPETQENPDQIQDTANDSQPAESNLEQPDANFSAEADDNSQRLPDFQAIPVNEDEPSQTDYAYEASNNASVSTPLEAPAQDAPFASESVSEHSVQNSDETSLYNEGDAAQNMEASVDATQSASEGSEQTGDVETLSSEEEEIRSKPKRPNFMRRYKIQEVIRRGQIVLVQVIKEERGNKGVSLTTYLSLPGRYCVLMPNSPKDGGISRKIASSEDRKRLKAISTELRLAKGMSVIIRTAGMDRTRAEIKRDYDYLVKVWNGVREETLKSTAPALIYEESDVIKRAIRDQYTSDIDEIVVEGEAGYQAAREFMQLLLPSHTPKVKEHTETTPLFYSYNVEDQLLSMHDPVVKLRSGGYIVINPTEALISIDVNSGRSTGERNIEETAAKTNLEAAVEVARQLRLRDLAGLIVIDFIDMMESRHRRAVEKALKDALKMDRAKIQLGRISPFGLLEMSRQRLRPSISETNMVQCSHCVGRGYIRSNESMSIQMIRALEKEASTGNWNGLRLILPQAVALHLLNNKRELLRGIEQRHNLTIQVLIDADMATSEFNLEKMRRSQSERGQNQNRPKQPRREEARESLEIDASSDEMTESNEHTELSSVESTEGESGNASNDNRRGRGRRGRRGGARRNNRDRDHNRPSGDVQGAEQAVLSENISDVADSAEAAYSTDSSGEKPSGERGNRHPRQRGNRNRRKWRDNRDGNPQERAPREHSSGTADLTLVEKPASYTNVLPAFATEDRRPEPIKPTEPERVAAVHALPPTPKDPNAPTKKGWWQKMIELDD